MAEDVDDFFLELGNWIIAHQPGFATIFEDDIACLEISKDDTLGEIEYVQANFHLGPSVLNLHLQNLAFITCPWPGIDDNRIIRGKFLDGFVNIEIQILILERPNEFLHFCITGNVFCAVVAAIIEQP